MTFMSALAFHPLAPGGLAILDARVERYKSSSQARSLSLQGWRLIDLLLRATFSPAHPLARLDVPVTLARVVRLLWLLKGVAKVALNCATFSPAQPRARRDALFSLASTEGTWPLHPLFSLKGRRGVCYTALPLNDRTAQQFLHSSLWNEKPKRMC